MKMGHIHRSILAGSPFWASLCANEYLSPEIESKSAQTARPNYGDGRSFPMDLKRDSGAAVDWFRQCDVVFQHTGGGVEVIQNEFPDAVYGIVFHNKNGQLPAAQMQRPKRVFCVPQKQFFAYPVGSVVPFPNFIPIEHDPFTPDESRIWEPPLKVCFTPSNQFDLGQGGDNSKAYRETVDILRRLEREGLVEPHVIQRTDHIVSLNRRRGCHVAIDECATGSYHRCSLEAASMGMVPISAVAPEVEALVEQFTGCDLTPFASTPIYQLEDFLRRLVADMHNAKVMGEFARQWMEKYWHPEILWRKVFVELEVEI